MQSILLVVIVVHGLIHFMGFAKAFGLADLPQLAQPISVGMGIFWLAAGIVYLAAAAFLAWTPRYWWMVGLGAVVLSQIVIVSAWSDAKVGTIANLLVLAGAVFGFAAQGPLSFRTEYRREVGERLERTASRPETNGALVTEADLAPLPEPVQRYLRLSGSVGKPRVHHFRATWRGRIRGTAQDPWMEFTAEQTNFLDEPSRFFLMNAKRGGLPVDVLHAFRDGSATMRVRLLSLVPLVKGSGPEFTRAETVTLFNDLCLLAPAALIDPAIRWEPIAARSVRGSYTVGANTVSAVLYFDEAGELVDFVSDDRLAMSSDGTQFTAQRWSTPVRDYQDLGGRRVMTHGAGRWHPPAGDFAYIELELVDLRINDGDPNRNRS